MDLLRAVSVLLVLCELGARPAPAAAEQARAPQPARGTRAAVALFACFADDGKAGHAAPDRAHRLFDHSLPGSFSHYLGAMSLGVLRVRGEAVGTAYAGGKPASGYTTADRQMRHGGFGALSREVLEQADRDADFSRFDNDGPDGVASSGDDDGVVDMVFVVLASVPQGFILADAHATGIAVLGLPDLFNARFLTAGQR
ncbi:MAG: hypothetical protein AB1505_19265 [Candidatus Latescibacterota bacterium]